MLENDTELEQDQLELVEEDTDDEAEDKEEDEQSESTEEKKEEEKTEESEPEESKEEGEKPHQNQKVEKRISSLTAKLKAKDEELAEARGRIAEFEDLLNKETEKVLQTFPEYRFKNKSIYELTPDEFKNAIDECKARTDLTSEQKLDYISEAQEAYNAYLKTIAPYQKEATAIGKESQALWQKDWETVQSELEEMYPSLKEKMPGKHYTYVDKLSSFIQDEINTRPLLAKRLRKNISEKFRYTLQAMEELGIDKQLEKEEYAKDSAPSMTAGKGKATPSKSKPPTFTRAQIDKMSPKEFDKWEKEIDRQAKAGLIK